MSFFTDIDGLSILERNSHRLEGMEMNSARKLLKQYKRAREELKARMLMAPDNTFTNARMEQALIQIEQGIQNLNRAIRPEIQQQFDFMSSQGVEDGTGELNYLNKKFAGVSSPLPIDAIIESTDPANYLFNQYASSVETYNATLRNRFQNVLTQSLLQQKTWSQAVFDMEQVFDTEEWQLARIVRTELHGIYNVSKNNGYSTIQEDYIPDLKKTLYHPMDSRTGEDSVYASKLKSLIVDVNEPFHYNWKGKERVFMTPPDRPNDRAILIPYREVWGKA